MLSVSNISVQFGSKKLFENVSFIVNSKNRVGLVGSNGSGKSTLLKALSGQIEPDSGDISLSKHSTVDYLPQEGITYSGKTIYEEVYSSLHGIAEVKAEIEQIQTELAGHTDKNSEDYAGLVERHGELLHRFEELEGFKIRSTIEKILCGLGFKPDEIERPTDEFSGGWQMRIALAKLLVKNPSVLLLDEPTNHLDLDSLLWLEDFLGTYEGAVIIVSHDRKFLDNMTKKIIEIYAGKVTSYPGNYTCYENEKVTRRELLEKRYNNQQRYLKQQERFIERFRYKNTKASAVQSRIKMLDKMEKIEIEDEESAIHFKFPPATHSGKKIIELKNVSKRYGDNLVLQAVNLEIMRGEKIGFVGINGAGKSTLARIITGTEDFQEGVRKLGHKVEIEFYSQHQADTLEPNYTVLETLDEMATGDIRKKLRTILGSFLFKGDDVFKKVSVLSGGEKSRLALARMLLKPSNFLTLDEPTNHLDMNSKRVLMNALNRYEGTLLIISHDRELLDGIVNKIIEVRDRNIEIYPGNCSEYIERKKEEAELGLNLNKTADKQDDSKKQRRAEAEVRNKRYRVAKPYKDKITEIENSIKLKEEKVKQIESNMLDESFFKDSSNVVRANAEFKQLKEELKDLYAEWMENNNKLREMETL